MVRHGRYRTACGFRIRHGQYRTGAAQRIAHQRRALESERAVGTNSVSKIATISLSEARPLQAWLGRKQERRITQIEGLSHSLSFIPAS